MSYFVSRQIQYPDGTKLVEVSAGGLDYANPDMLVSKYAGEGKEYISPVDAVEVALSIAKAWSKDTGEVIGVGYGATGGFTMPFDESGEDELRAWADKRYEAMPKCDQCGDPLPAKDKQWRLADGFGELFCSEYCCNKAFEYNEQANADFEAEYESEA